MKQSYCQHCGGPASPVYRFCRTCLPNVGRAALMGHVATWNRADRLYRRFRASIGTEGMESAREAWRQAAHEALLVDAARAKEVLRRTQENRKARSGQAALH